MKITMVWKKQMSWNFVRFHEIWFQTEPESFSFLSWKTKKNLSRTAKIDPKDGVSRLNFPECFAEKYQRKEKSL